MKANTWGDSGEQGRIFDGLLVDFSDDPSPRVSRPIEIAHYNGASFQLVSGGARSIAIQDGDSVDATAHEFRLAAGNFKDTDVGGAVTIAGSDEGNDGTYTVDTVINAFTITTVEAPAGDEDFDPDAVTAEIVQVSPPGAWDFWVSNTYCAGSSTETPNDGEPWTPIGQDFANPAIEAVTEQYIKNTSNSANQFIQADPLDARAMKVVFTPAAGDPGPISAFGFAKGNR
jgi:hypothetical protein